MTQKEFLERARKAIAELKKVPPEVQWREMIEQGLINEQGEVLWNLELAKKHEAQTATPNGDPSPDSASHP